MPKGVSAHAGPSDDLHERHDRLYDPLAHELLAEDRQSEQHGCPAGAAFAIPGLPGSGVRFHIADGIPHKGRVDEVDPSLRYGGPFTPRCGMAEAEDGLPVPSEAMAGSIQG